MSANEIKRDEIIRMAREAGSIDSEDVILTVYAAFGAHERNRHAWTQEHWTQYEHAIAAAEREACAKVCEEGINNATDWDSSYWDQCCENRAAAIRARGEK